MQAQKTNLFDIINGAVLTILSLLCVIPFLHLIAKSFSGDIAIISGKVKFWPVQFHLSSYEYVLFQSGFLQAFRVSLFVTIVGTLSALLITVMAAYPLSKPEFKGRRFILLLYVFSMLFYGGIIPVYMLMRFLDLIDTVWAMIIPLLVSPFNLLVIKTFLEGHPESLEESAKIDGASNTRILFSIILPISLPVLATMGLFYAVNYWNNFFHPMLFISKPALKPLQLYLYEMLTTASELSQLTVEEALNLSTEGVRAATIMVATLPILLLYPFLQKYFVKGLTIGSVKG